MSDSIHPSASIGYVHLIISNLQKSLHFYKEKIGFRVLEQNDKIVSLTADGIPPLLMLEEKIDASVKPARTSGLYHFAILVPNRSSLGLSLLHLLQERYPLQGASDHQFSEAVYLADPDGNGIEIYADRPREEWQINENGEYKGITIPMDAEAVLAAATNLEWKGLPKKTVIGHVHLHVSDLGAAEEFYLKGMGFEKTMKMGNSALFVSAGGYHHHLGLNVWAGIGAPQPPENSVGLKHFSIKVPSHEELEKAAARLTAIGTNFTFENGSIKAADPSGNHIILVSK